LNFIERFSKNVQTTSFTQIRQIGAELFHEEAHTDMTKLVVAFSNFANASKNKRNFYGKSLCQLRKAVRGNFI